MKEFIDENSGLGVRPIEGCSEGHFIREDGLRMRKRRSGLLYSYISGSVHKRNGYVNTSIDGKQYRMPHIRYQLPIHYCAKCHKVVEVSLQGRNVVCSICG